MKNKKLKQHLGHPKVNFPAVHLSPPPPLDSHLHISGAHRKRLLMLLLGTVFPGWIWAK